MQTLTSLYPVLEGIHKILLYCCHGDVTMNLTQKVNSAEKHLIVIEANKRELLRGLSIAFLTIFVFLFLRIILKLAGSDPQSLFVSFIYLVSDIILLPFFGIFPQFHQPALPGRISIDVTAVIAIFCYPILIFLAMSIVGLGANILKTQRQKEETVEKSRSLDTTNIETIVK